MGRDFQYRFYDKDNQEIKSRLFSDYFKLGHCGYPDSGQFERIEIVFDQDILKRIEDPSDDELFGKYSLEELNDSIEIISKRYSGKQLLSLSYEPYYIEDSLLKECYQLALLVCDAENYNKENENKVEYISFGYY